MSLCGWLRGFVFGRNQSASVPDSAVEAGPLRPPGDVGTGALPVDETWEEPVDNPVDGPAAVTAPPYGAPLHPERTGQLLPVDVTGYGRQHSSSGTTWAIDASLDGHHYRAVGAGIVRRVSDRSDPANGVGVWVELTEGPLRGAAVAGIHLSARSVEVGDHVERGQILGITGSTGDSTGPHLHWEIAGPRGEMIDPMDSALFGWAEAGWTWEGWP